jgi:hypothetical protein
MIAPMVLSAGLGSEPWFRSLGSEALVQKPWFRSLGSEALVQKPWFRSLGSEALARALFQILGGRHRWQDTGGTDVAMQGNAARKAERSYVSRSRVNAIAAGVA